MSADNDCSRASKVQRITQPTRLFFLSLTNDTVGVGIDQVHLLADGTDYSFVGAIALDILALAPCVHMEA